MNLQPATEPTVDIHDRARDLVRDLQNPTPAIFWTDLIVTAVVSWSFFAASLYLRSYASALSLVVAALALYRGLCFIHELTHIRAKTLPGFQTAWNCLFGVPLLLPSFTYIGVHQDHHRIATYGTEHDPEYLPFAKSNLVTIFFVLHSILIPAFLVVRFVVLAPFALLIPPFHRLLAERCSALCMNLAYKRVVNANLLRSMRIWEAVTFLYGAGIATAAFTGVISWRVPAMWYAAAAIVCVVNTLRTLGAHDYESDGSPLNRTGQILDSIDTPGAWWTELWAPVGLRYHALHHYFPGIPYHNLSEAHTRLFGGLPLDSAYHQTLSPSLLHSLKKLYNTGCAARARSATQSVHVK